MLRVVFLVIAIALNITFKAPCFCYILLAFMLLNIRIKALFKSFLALIISLLSFS